MPSFPEMNFCRQSRQLILDRFVDHRREGTGDKFKAGSVLFLFPLQDHFCISAGKETCQRYDNDQYHKEHRQQHTDAEG